jgi:dipeptidyl aminopeptidase/acylaminoacyl peptidase
MKAGTSFRVCSFRAGLGVLLLGTLELFGASIFRTEARQQNSSAKEARATGLAERRLVTQEDAIRMTRIAGHGSAGEYAGTLTHDFAYFSPDGKRFAVVLKRGNLEANTNDYLLVVFQTEHVFDKPEPKTLAVMSSSSNREGIKDVAWLADSETILFLGEQPGETTQLYALNCATGRLRKLTNHATNLIAFSSDEQGHAIVYAVERPRAPVVNERSRREAMVVNDEAMADLLSGSIGDNERDLMVLDTKTGSSRTLPLGAEIHGKLWGDLTDFFTSPDGRYVAVRANLTEVSPKWRQYKEPLLRKMLQRDLPPGALSWIFRYAMIETETGRGRVLLDSPVSDYGSEIGWSPDGCSVVLTGVSLPIEESQSDGKLLGTPGVVEVNLLNLHHTLAAPEDLRFLHWDRKTNVLAFEVRRRDSKPSERRYFKKFGEHWKQIDGNEQETVPVEIVAEQDLNTPPKIAALDRKTGRKALLLDLNPQFNELKFGKVEEIKFFGAGHLEVRAGLYFPPDFEPGKKYPLVVQTHGFDANGFWIDGPFTTGFAAQALASRDLLVLQIPDRHDWSTETPQEAPRMMETIENAIGFVDGLGILDRDRLAIVGFSRTGLYVQYMLTHSKIHFRAAVVAEGSDGGYSQYLQFLDAHPYTASDSESINGGVPFGSGLLYWLRRSPEFLVDTIDTPLMIQAASPESLSMLWAVDKGLRRLGKPAELIYLPTGTHILEKPWDRMASQKGTVDWCVFWLNGEEDGAPENSKKYQRWRRMRESLVTSQTQ